MEMNPFKKKVDRKYASGVHITLGKTHTIIGIALALGSVALYIANLWLLSFTTPLRDNDSILFSQIRAIDNREIDHYQALQKTVDEIKQEQSGLRTDIKELLKRK